MLHLCQKISFGFTATQKYVLKNFKYLVQAPPKRPVTGFGLFVKEKTQGKTGVNAAKQLTELSNTWNSLKPQEKEPYQNQFKTQNEAFKKVKAQYDNKYVLPFKTISSSSLFMQHLYKDKVITVKQKTPIQEYAKQFSKLSKEKTPEQAAKYKDLAKKLREENEKKISAFTFPERLYNSQSAFTRNNPQVKEQDRKKEYQAYVEKWNNDVKKWLEENKIGMSIEQFLKLYNRQLNKKLKTARSKRQENQQPESKSSEDKAPKKKAAQRTAKKAKTTEDKAPQKKVAKRTVKKAKATRAAKGKTQSK